MLKILIVDDEDSVIDLISAHLRALLVKFPEILIVSSKTIEGARKIIYTPPPPDIVLLDLRLEDSDAVATMNEIAEFERSCPVLVITGMGSIFYEIKAEVEKKGASGFLHKRELKEKSLIEGIISTLSVWSNKQRQESNALHLKMSEFWKPDGTAE